MTGTLNATRLDRVYKVSSSVWCSRYTQEVSRRFVTIRPGLENSIWVDSERRRPSTEGGKKKGEIASFVAANQDRADGIRSQGTNSKPFQNKGMSNLVGSVITV
ncbi:uncharacterized protein LOC114871982 isoform X2 [Osmia bicornis bicornis]|uniref:uncharacterized protein LOC114871982 isoform X2 n=1 Tax=Osmia bicornis bicornis TaxID=1437191 RepID=UPI001EAF49FE|nr:uncharacterized protein LOC114871982 isoform X2 [Osmia bicornis bicornis]